MITLREKHYGKQFCSILPLVMGAGAAANIGGSLFGGLFGSSAERRRATAIREAGERGARDITTATTDANTRSQQQLDVARGDLSPFRDMGAQAGNSLASLLMGGGDLDGMLKESALFRFQSDSGSRNINRELAARGLYGSGAGLETLARFNNQLVAEEGQRLTDRLFNLTNIGANSAATMAGMTNQTGLAQAGNIFSGGVNAANMRFNAATGAAQAQSNSTRMLGEMGQNIFNSVGGGLMQYGNYVAHQPFIEGAINANARMTGGGGGAGFSMTSAVPLAMDRSVMR